MRWWPWARRAEVAYQVPPRAVSPILPPAPPAAAALEGVEAPVQAAARASVDPHGPTGSAGSPGGVRLVMGDGSALELPAGTPQARAFAAVADALVQGLPQPVQRAHVQALGHLADE